MGSQKKKKKKKKNIQNKNIKKTNVNKAEESVEIQESAKETENKEVNLKESEVVEETLDAVEIVENGETQEDSKECQEEAEVSKETKEVTQEEESEETQEQQEYDSECEEVEDVSKEVKEVTQEESEETQIQQESNLEGEESSPEFIDIDNLSAQQTEERVSVVNNIINKFKDRQFLQKFILICVGVVIAIAGSLWIYENSIYYKVCRIEAGVEFHINDFLKSERKQKWLVNGSDKIDTTVPGEYPLQLQMKFYKHNGTLIVEDTIAPVVEVHSVDMMYGEQCDVSDFITKIQDATKTQVRFVKEVDFSKTDEQTVQIEVTDAGNNSTVVEAKLTVSYVKDLVVVEAGGKKPEVSEFLLADKEAKIHTDLDSIDYKIPAKHDIEIELEEKTYKTVLEVKDTVAPVFEVKNLDGYTKCKTKAEEFVTSASDVTPIVYSFEGTVDFTKVGNINVKVVGTDGGGNTCVKEAKMTLKEDTEAPIIEGEEINVFVEQNVSYRTSVVVKDNCPHEPELTIDTSKVNTKKVGSYPVIYTATDCSGNTTSKTVTLEVRERAYSLEDVNAIANKALAKILKPEMSQYDKVKAIFDYIKRSISYISFSEKGDYIRSAYEGLTQGKGDCYVYASTTKVMLNCAGITNMDIERIPAGETMHYWNLVDIGDGHGWYHLDTTPRIDRPVIFLWDDAQIKKYSDSHKNSHNYDRALYPVIN